jgi:ABC-type polysaccharide/polyol phosphate export permease
LIYALTQKDIRIKYKQSIMGFMWAIFMPMLIVSAGILVRKAISIATGRPLDMSVLASVSVKSLPWAFFIGSVRFATASLTSNINLVTKIYFPREVFPISAVLSNLFDFAVASVPLTIFLICIGVGISIHIIWLPLIFAILIVFTVGMGLLLSCANLYFRDVKYIVEAILTFGIFFTPVFYEAEMLGRWDFVVLLNPVGSLLEAINDVVVLHTSPDFIWLTYAGVMAALTFMMAWVVFKKAEPTFAENI